MGIEKFGTVSFTAETKAADFVIYLEQGKVMATRCKGCGANHFPPKMDCPNCLSSDAEWFEINGNGKLLTYTTVNYGPTGFEDEAPYTLAIAGFAEDLKVFGRMSKSIEEGDIKIGMDVKVVPVKLANDRVSYEFQKD